MSWLDTLEDIRKKDFTKTPMAQRDEAARDVVNMASYACAVVSVSLIGPPRWTWPYAACTPP